MIGEQRLENRPAALAPGHAHGMRLHGAQQPQRIEIGHHLFSCLGYIQSLVGAGNGIVQPTIGRQDGDGRQAVALTHLVVVEIMPWGDLDATCAKGWVHHGIGENRDEPLGEWQAEFLTYQGLIALVFGVDGHSHIAQ